MKRFRNLLIVLLVTVIGASLYAQDATVTFVSGKVEVQRGGSWVALNKGDRVSKSDMISTGFQSEAKIKIIDSVLYLGPVTRITLEELSSQGDQDNVNVYLKTGTVRSQVRHVDNKRVNYQVHTAVAVASCRGTGWIIDDSNNIIGLDGTISVSAFVLGKNGVTVSFGDGIMLSANQTLKVSKDGKVSAPKSSVETLAEKIISAVSTEGGAPAEAKAKAPAADSNNQGETPAATPKVSTGTVSVECEYVE